MDQKKSKRFESFSGTESINYLAEKFRAKHFSIRQFAEYDDETVYDRNRLVIGLGENEEGYSFNLQKSAKIIAIAPTGSGKTILQQGVLSRFYAAGGLCAIPTDIKGEEYSSCINPAQKAHHGKLLKFPVVRPVDEKPIGLPIKTYYPYFFSKFVTRDFPDQQFCQFRSDDINMYDFLTIADIDPTAMSALQKNALETLFEKIRKKEISTLREMSRFLENSKDIRKDTARLLTTVISQLETQEVIGSQYPTPDFVKDINDGKIPVLNSYGALSAGKKINGYISAYISVILRRIYNAKSAGEIQRKKHLLIILDEVARFCPNIGNPSSKVAILDLLRLSRSEKISMFFSAQYMTDVPDILVDQATHIFIPGKRMNTETIRTIMQRFAPWEIDNPQVMSQNISLRQSQMPKWGWFCLDKMKSETVSFVPALPLCYHRSE